MMPQVSRETYRAHYERKRQLTLELCQALERWLNIDNELALTSADQTPSIATPEELASCQMQIARLESQIADFQRAQEEKPDDLMTQALSAMLPALQNQLDICRDNERRIQKQIDLDGAQ